MLAARQTEERERFTLQLATAAAPETLATWLQVAAPGDEAVYATGIELPREAAGVQQARAWAAAGKVSTHQRRDPADGRRWQYLIVKKGAGAGDSPALPAAARVTPARVADRGQLASLMAILRACAERDKPCPSNAGLAARLGIGRDKRAWDRAQYLMARLVREQRIAVESRGTCAPRVVTILAAGRACGRSTAA